MSSLENIPSELSNRPELENSENIEMLTKRMEELIEHFKENPNDHENRLKFLQYALKRQSLKHTFQNK